MRSNLSTAEGLMLLALNDDKGTVVFSASTALPLGLAGGLLLDLYFLDKIALSGKMVKLIDGNATGEKLMDKALELLTKSDKPQSIKHWVKEIERKVPQLKEKVTNTLVEKGILRREAHKILWMFPTKRYPTRDKLPEVELRTRICNIVLHGHEASERDLALVSLIRACDLIAEVFSKQDRKKAKKNIKVLTANENIGKAVSALTEEIIAAVMVITATTSTITTIS